MERLGGYYCNPRNAEGERLGPFVGYAKKDERGRQYVGDVYYDFAVVEETSEIKAFAQTLMASIRLRANEHTGKTIWVFGMPMGGLRLAGALFDEFHAAGLPVRYGFLEKKVTKVAEGDQREESKLVFGRHQPEKGDIVIIVEDVVNNMTTAGEATALFESVGAIVTAIGCAINRSYPFMGEFVRDGREPIKVIATVEKSTPQWRQDDPEIAEDLARLGFVPKAKHERELLQAVMREAAA